MKGIVLRILKEVGIFIAMLIVLLAAIVIAFKDQLPYEDKIPSGEVYVSVSKDKYSVNSTDRISEVNIIKITHEANSGQIIDAENEVRIQTGKYTPFGTIDSTTDLPTERVGINYTPSTEESGGGNNNQGSSNFEYPVSEDEANLLRSGETETSESAAKRRMGNVE